jgi:hypothetical protein
MKTTPAVWMFDVWRLAFDVFSLTEVTHEFWRRPQKEETE